MRGPTVADLQCAHGTFEAAVQIGRMFDSDEAIAAGGDPDSVTVEVRAWCLECGKAVRFEGPIGVSVGPGARPMVSLDGKELRATGHLGENRTPSITASLTCMAAISARYARSQAARRAAT